MYYCLSVIGKYIFRFGFFFFLSSENVPHDFECKVEIYCHKLHEDLTIASTPKKLKKKINDLSGSVGRSVGKRLSGLVRICTIIFIIFLLVH